MAIATGSRHSAAYIEESTFGTTPASPVMTPIRHNSFNISLSKDSLVSEELRSDRQISDFRGGVKSVSGDVATEFSYGTFDDFLEAGLGGTWATDTPALGSDQLEAGTTRRSFTIQRHFEDINVFDVYTGCSVNTISMSVQPNAIVSVTFGFIGKGNSGTQISGYSLSAATTTTPFDAFTGTINEGGSSNGVVTSLDLSIDNGLEAVNVVGSDETLEPSIGRSNITGTVAVWFENRTLADKFINETESSIDFTLVDAAGNQYLINLPRIKYTSGPIEVGGEGPITISLDFQALLDSVTGTNIQITRTPV